MSQPSASLSSEPWLVRPGRFAPLTPAEIILIGIPLLGLGIALGLTLPFLIFYTQMMGASVSSATLVFSTLSAASLISAPLWGIICDRIGPRWTIFLSLIGISMAYGWLASATWWSDVFSARILHGLMAGTMPAVLFVAGRITSVKARPSVFGIVGATFAGGITLGPGIASLLLPHVDPLSLESLYAYHVLLWMSCFITIACTLLFVVGHYLLRIWQRDTSHWDAIPFGKRTPRSVPPHDDTSVDADLSLPVDPPSSSLSSSYVAGSEGAARPATTSEPSSQSSAAPNISNPRGQGFLGIIGVTGLLILCITVLSMFTGIESSFAVWAQQMLSASPQQIGTLIFISGIANITTQGGLINLLLKRVSITTAFYLAWIFLGCGAALMVTGQWTPAILGVIVLGMGIGIWMPIVQTAMSQISSPHKMGRSMGYVQSAGHLARIVGPLWAAAILSVTSSSVILMIAIGGFASITVGFALWLYRRRSAALRP